MTAELEVRYGHGRDPRADLFERRMVMPKGSRFRTIAEYRRVNRLLEPTAVPIWRFEEPGVLLRGGVAFRTLGIIREHWQLHFDVRVRPGSLQTVHCRQVF